MTTSDLLSIRLENQFLTTEKLTTPEKIVAHFGAVQSQDYVGAKWALGQRLKNATDATLENAFNKGEMLRTHVMRPTWHFVSPKDIRWMLELTKPRVKQAMSSYNKLLELDDDVFDNSIKIFQKAFENENHLTRHELKKHLDTAGIPTNVQRLAHIVMNAELDGIICSGPREEKQFTYALIEKRVLKSNKLTKEEALKELAQRYFTSHGPATIKDFVWWSGLLTSDAKSGIEMLGADLKQEDIDGLAYFYFPSKISEIGENFFLLPNYDEYAIAYKNRDAFYNPEASNSLIPFGQNAFSHMMVFKGVIRGMWKRTITKDKLVITPQFVSTPTQKEMAELEKATAKYAKFLDLPFEIGSLA